MEKGKSGMQGMGAGEGIAAVESGQEIEGVAVSPEDRERLFEEWKKMSAGDKMDLFEDGDAEDKVRDAWLGLEEVTLGADIWNALSESERVRYKEGGGLVDTKLGKLVARGQVGEVGMEEKGKREGLSEKAGKRLKRVAVGVTVVGLALGLWGWSRFLKQGEGGGNSVALGEPAAVSTATPGFEGTYGDSSAMSMPFGTPAPNGYVYNGDVMPTESPEVMNESVNRTGYVGPAENGLFAIINEAGEEVNNPDKIAPVAYAESLMQDFKPGREGDAVPLADLERMGMNADVLYSRWLNGLDGENMDGSFWQPVSMAEHAHLLSDDELGRFGLSRGDMEDQKRLEDTVESWDSAVQREFGMRLKARLDGMDRRVGKHMGAYYVGYVRPTFENGKLVRTERIQTRGNRERTTLEFYNRETGERETLIFVTCTQVPREGEIPGVPIVEVPEEEDPESTPDPTPEPTSDPTPEPTPEPTSEPTPEPTPTPLEGKDESLTNEDVSGNSQQVEQGNDLTDRLSGGGAPINAGGGSEQAGSPIVADGAEEEPPEGRQEAVDNATVVSGGDGLESAPTGLPPSEGDGRETETGGASDAGLGNQFGDRF